MCEIGNAALWQLYDCCFKMSNLKAEYNFWWVWKLSLHCRTWKKKKNRSYHVIQKSKRFVSKFWRGVLFHSSACLQAEELFCSFNIDLAGSVAHPPVSTPLPSQIGEPLGRRQHLQRPITSLIAYQIQFCIVANEAKVFGSRRVGAPTVCGKERRVAPVIPNQGDWNT